MSVTKFILHMGLLALLTGCSSLATPNDVNSINAYSTSIGSMPDPHPSAETSGVKESFQLNHIVGARLSLDQESLIYSMGTIKRVIFNDRDYEGNQSNWNSKFYLHQRVSNKTEALKVSPDSGLLNGFMESNSSLIFENRKEDFTSQWSRFNLNTLEVSPLSLGRNISPIQKTDDFLYYAEENNIKRYNLNTNESEVRQTIPLDFYYSFNAFMSPDQDITILSMSKYFDKENTFPTGSFKVASVPPSVNDVYLIKPDQSVEIITAISDSTNRPLFSNSQQPIFSPKLHKYAVFNQLRSVAIIDLNQNKLIEKTHGQFIAWLSETQYLVRNSEDVSVHTVAQDKPQKIAALPSSLDFNGSTLTFDTENKHLLVSTAHEIRLYDLSHLESIREKVLLKAQEEQGHLNISQDMSSGQILAIKNPIKKGLPTDVSVYDPQTKAFKLILSLPYQDQPFEYDAKEHWNYGPSGTFKEVF